MGNISGMTAIQSIPLEYLGQEPIHVSNYEVCVRYVYADKTYVTIYLASGSYKWIDMNGEKHCLTGPAVYYADANDSRYYRHGTHLKREDFIRLYEVTFLEEYKGT